MHDKLTNADWAEVRRRLDEEPTDPPETFSAQPYVRRDPKTIPPRQWLHAGHYIRGFLSATIAPGGLGKTSLQLVEAVGMVCGRDLLKGTTVPPLNVWYWNLEDPRDEIDRRIAGRRRPHTWWKYTNKLPSLHNFSLWPSPCQPNGRALQPSTYG
jgi:AAA domain